VKCRAYFSGVNLLKLLPIAWREVSVRIDIKALAEKVSERYNTFIDELRSVGRRRVIVKARGKNWY